MEAAVFRFGHSQRFRDLVHRHHGGREREIAKHQYWRVWERITRLARDRTTYRFSLCHLPLEPVPRNEGPLSRTPTLSILV